MSVGSKVLGPNHKQISYKGKNGVCWGIFRMAIDRLPEEIIIANSFSPIKVSSVVDGTGKNPLYVVTNEKGEEILYTKEGKLTGEKMPCKKCQAAGKITCKVGACSDGCSLSFA